MDKEFDESKHPRDETGKFTEGVGTKAEQEKLKKLGISTKESKENSNLSNEEKRLEEITGDANTSTIQSKERTPFGGARHKDYLDALVIAKKTLSPKIAWRVADYGGNIEEFKVSHPNVTLHITAGGSTVAVEPNGDIIAVCKKTGDKVRGSEMIQLAVANGDKKLDSYAGNHKFYCKNGFEAVSWCAFNEEYAPHDWKKAMIKNPLYFIDIQVRNRLKVQKSFMQECQ